MTKVWQKPKLIILYRGRPEESVLLGCKTATSGAAVRAKDNGCAYTVGCNFYCETIENS